MANKLSREISRQKVDLNERRVKHLDQNVVQNQSFWRKLLTFALLGIFVWLCVSATRMFLTYNESRKNFIFAENQKKQVEADIAELRKKIDQVKTGAGVEEHLREKYPVVKEGERVLVISDTEVAPAPAKKTFWQKIKSFF